MGLFGNLFDDNAKDLKRYNKVLAQINSYEEAYKKLSDADLAAKSADFRLRLENGEELAALLPEAFATVREAAWRSVGMRPYDVQMVGGITLFNGRIAEMKTGEGKTLVATAPAYLHALAGLGAHVITVNDYLAQRDSQWMGRVYGFLGLSTGLIIHGVEPAARRDAYAADITYGTNNEFGFDYLRDNMCFSQESMVQRPLNYCIVDEVDSILVDEARTPLIISGPSDKPDDMYYTAANVVTRLREEVDYTIDLKTRQAALTEDGVAKVEQSLGISNLYDPANTAVSHHVNQALRARYVYKRDRDYVVREGQVIIVDEFTGRLMFGRRYGEGLHQAIEAKEKVKIERESQTLATITYQNYFRMYKVLAGMTGTAKTEETEFEKIYKLDVVEIPPNLPNIRQDHQDAIYRTEQGKYEAVVEEIVTEHEQGRPVLVGTISIEKSEHLSKMLHKRGVEHQVLNAKFHEQEAHIVAQAGRKDAVTIATNMAGRGTDILLGGNPEALARTEVPYLPEELDLETYYAEAREAYLNATKAKSRRQQAMDKWVERSMAEVRARIDENQAKYEQALERYKQQTSQEHELVTALGGLHIIGTERHESRRIDNQLRGRAGRQGDPGSTRFFLSMEDDLMKRFGGEKMGDLMDRWGMDDSTPLDVGLSTRMVEQAQKRVEERNFLTRKSVLDYDDVMNQQRELIYSERRKALTEADVHDSVLAMLDAMADKVLGRYSPVSQFPEEWELGALIGDLAGYIPQYLPTEEELKALSKDEVYALVHDKVHQAYDIKAEALGAEKLSSLEHTVILRVVDAKWMEHLDAMDQLRQGIGLRGLGQLDPLVEYKREAFDMFEAMVEEIQLEVSRLVLLGELVERPQERQNLVSNKEGQQAAKKQPLRKDAKDKVGRNDPCPCGSNKKYKNCCGKNG